MYTLHMSWPLRSLVLGLVIVWGLAPQLACFMPEHSQTEAEKDCCEKMASDCHGTSMSQCCQTSVRTDVAIAGKTIRSLMPHSDVVFRTADVVTISCFTFSSRFLTERDQSPPDKPGVFFLTLRI